MKPTLTNNHPILKHHTNDEKKIWFEKYVNPLLISQEYDLIIDEPIPGLFLFPFFNENFCKEIIQLAEELNQWEVDRHDNYPTTDILLEKLDLKHIYDETIQNFVTPMLVAKYNLQGRSWYQMDHENFIIKYSDTAQKHLSLHHDNSALTINLCLNNEFEGGGTYFPKFKKLLRLDKIGYAMVHPGNITHFHGARPIESGNRYIIVSFLKTQ
ncbi:hypothetical protein [Aureibacter tunicatorum]|uniref:Fe2OG dioxygenase domain-containing protein n=1 Tax=Aureibacter tunicatorum TaxID=866807 RepID=A0AAE4BVN8_9BACT|nr:hypothetical protein [Aureibacter tunicatorum]MDR6241873.1 hypothetical protein [Aureibacter tunicatorum]BDD07480.1 hypothetical protein AUTU_49630 [Aureibacter tunicatorum]